MPKKKKSTGIPTEPGHQYTDDQIAAQMQNLQLAQQMGTGGPVMSGGGFGGVPDAQPQQIHQMPITEERATHNGVYETTDSPLHVPETTRLYRAQPGAYAQEQQAGYGGWTEHKGYAKGYMGTQSRAVSGTPASLNAVDIPQTYLDRISKHGKPERTGLSYGSGQHGVPAIREGLHETITGAPVLYNLDRQTHNGSPKTAKPKKNSKEEESKKPEKKSGKKWGIKR